jgi:hypothetical protein
MRIRRLTAAVILHSCEVHILSEFVLWKSAFVCGNCVLFTANMSKLTQHQVHIAQGRELFFKWTTSSRYSSVSIVMTI